MDRLETARRMWAAGDYATWGDLFAEVGQTVVKDVGAADLDVLDVATGTGNTAIAAARAGGRVTALDLTPELLTIAGERADAQGLDIRWVEADMARLDFTNEAFDRVLSTFGVMLAPDPVAMAAELVRVCRPGGLIVTTCWRADAAFSRMGEVIGGYFPPPPSGAGPPHDPLDWARPERVTAFFADQPVELTVDVRSVPVTWGSAREAITMLTQACGPLSGAVAALEADGRWPQARAEVTRMLADGQEVDAGALTVEMPYLLVLARRR